MNKRDDKQVGQILSSNDIARTPSRGFSLERLHSVISNVQADKSKSNTPRSLNRTPRGQSFHDDFALDEEYGFHRRKQSKPLTPRKMSRLYHHDGEDRYSTLWGSLDFFHMKELYYMQQDEKRRRDEFFKQKQSVTYDRITCAGKDMNVAPKACCLDSNSRIRKVAFTITKAKHFNNIIIGAIVINSLILLINNLVPTFADSLGGQVIEWFFCVLFLSEAILRMLSRGVISHPDAYFRDIWCWVDFIVVVFAIIERFFYVYEVEAFNPMVIRCLRLLRPLRTLNAFPEMKLIVKMLFGAIPSLADLLGMAFFVFSLFVIIGITMSKSDYWSKCRYNQFPAPIRDNENKIVWPSNWEYCGFETCPAEMFCGGINIARAHLSPDDFEEWAWEELKKRPESDYGISGFQNFGSGILTVFQVATLEGWTTLMYRYMQTANKGIAAFCFIILVIVGAMFVLNVTMAILWEQFEKATNPLPEMIDKWCDHCRVARAICCCSIDEKESAPPASRQLKKSASSSGFVLNFDEINDSIPLEQMNPDHGKWVDQMGSLEELMLARDHLAQLVTVERRKRLSYEAEVSSSEMSRALVKEWLHSNRCTYIIFTLISINSLLLALDQHPPLQPEIVSILEYCNFAFTVIFTLEILAKVFAYDFRSFCSDWFNIFDFIVVVLSWIEISISEKGSSMSALRACRLLRVFKLAKNWVNLRILLSVMGKSVHSMYYFLLVVLLIVYIFMLLGIEIFKGSVNELQRTRFARLHFEDPYWAFITVFTVFTGDVWADIMGQLGFLSDQRTMTAIFFVVLYIVASLVLLNIFLAILGANFGKERDNLFLAVKEDLLKFERCKFLSQSETPPIEVVVKKFVDDLRKKKPDAWYSELMSTDTPIHNENTEILLPIRNACSNFILSAYFDPFIVVCIMCSSIALAWDSPLEPPGAIQLFIEPLFTVIFTGEMLIKMLAFGCFNPHSIRQKQEPNNETIRPYFRSGWNFVDFIVVIAGLVTMFYHTPALSSLRALRAFRPLRIIRRNKGMKLVVSTLVSSIPALASSLCVAFLLQLVCAILGVSFFKGKFGFCSRKPSPCELKKWAELPGTIEGPDLFPFTNSYTGWNQASEFCGETKKDALNNCIAVCFLDSCAIRLDGIRKMTTDPAYGIFIRSCSRGQEEVSLNKDNCLAEGYQWKIRPVNFDNVLNAMVSLFQVATTADWTVTMFNAVDGNTADIGWVPNSHPQAAMFFVLWIFVGSFFLCNLFFGVIIDHYQLSIRERDGTAFASGPEMREKQQKLHELQRMILKSVSIPLRPAYLSLPPEDIKRWHKLQHKILNVIEYPFTENLILFLILLNSLIMCSQTATMRTEVQETFEYIQKIFAVIFTIEVFLKIVGYTPKVFWINEWNKFDFIVVIGTDLGLAWEITSPNNSIGSIGLILRSFRILRILRLVKKAQGIKTMFTTFFVTLPAIGNISAVLFLFFFIYATMGMSLFGKQMLHDNITPLVNFGYFGSALLAMIRASTGDGWLEIMIDVAKDPSDSLGACDPVQSYESILEVGPRGCGSSNEVAIFYFMSFQVLVCFVVMSLFIGAVLDGFNESSVAHEYDIVLKGVQRFYEKWAEIEPSGSRLLTVEQWVTLLLDVPYPMGYKDHPTMFPHGSQMSATRVRLRVLGSLKMYVRSSKVKCLSWENKVHFSSVLLQCCERTCRIFGVADITGLPSDSVFVESFLVRFPEVISAGILKRNNEEAYPGINNLESLLAIQSIVYRFKLKMLLTNPERRQKENDINALVLPSPMTPHFAVRLFHDTDEGTADDANTPLGMSLAHSKIKSPLGINSIMSEANINIMNEINDEDHFSISESSFFSPNGLTPVQPADIILVDETEAMIRPGRFGGCAGLTLPGLTCNNVCIGPAVKVDSTMKGGPMPIEGSGTELEKNKNAVKHGRVKEKIPKLPWEIDAKRLKKGDSHEIRGSRIFKESFKSIGSQKSKDRHEDELFQAKVEDNITPPRTPPMTTKRTPSILSRIPSLLMPSHYESTPRTVTPRMLMGSKDADYTPRQSSSGVAPDCFVSQMRHALNEWSLDHAKQLCSSPEFLHAVDRRGYTCLDYAVDDEEAYIMMRKKGADHSLFWAIRTNNIPIFRTMIACGADLSVHDAFGERPIDIVHHEAVIQVIEIWSPHVNIRMISKENETNGPIQMDDDNFSIN